MICGLRRKIPLKYKSLALVFSLALWGPSSIGAAGFTAELCSLNLPSNPVSLAFKAATGARPFFQAGPCTLSLTCEYPPPASVSCSGTTGCSSGADGIHGWQGWVQCDSGPYLACSPPPPPQCAVASCTSNAECLDACSVEVSPSSYQCVDSCCVCSYKGK